MVSSVLGNMPKNYAENGKNLWAAFDLGRRYEREAMKSASAGGKEIPPVDGNSFDVSKNWTPKEAGK